MADLRDVELRIAVAEGVLSRSEADVLGEEARRAQQSPLALLVARGRISDESYQSFFAAALNDPAWRAAGQDASASTYTMEAVPPAVTEPPFPVAVWDRYINVRFLGQGGMGKVFLAVDTGLRREVAIKFVRGDDAEHVRRLIAEARTQARVSHERVCRVYEVGEVDGKVYIAMQYIHGKPLGQLLGELTLEQKVMLVRGAADGIQEAHSKGIIHRDIKPSNIMVERTDDGDIRPYVMDFGLARSAQEAGTTMTGAVLGTPRYMAPEQAQGETAKLDRRADIYSLGATLYHLVTGAPPVRGETAAEVIAHLISEEPIPPRGHDANIPVDLEAIVLKCLEKDRTERYDSARALVDDLDRFLRGEPVHARPADTWYRLAKLLAKHRRLIAVATVLLVALAVAVGWAIRTSRASGTRERLAREFTERVERIESTARNSALAPRHDIRRDQDAIRRQMSELRADIDRAGELAAGPGHYALGRGYLALGEEAQAWDELAAAWRDGFREPHVAYSLAVVMGHRYQQALLAAERADLEDKARRPDDARRDERREATKREISRSYRDPALGFLLQSGGAEQPSPGYVPALVAFYEGRLDEALAHLATGDGLPWSYEAHKLRGDVLFARARGAGGGDSGERGRGEFEAGRRAYAAAAEIGRSVPDVAMALAELEYAAMTLRIFGKGEDVVASGNRALAAVARALEAMPDHYEALVLQARVRRILAEYQARQGTKVEDLLAKALDDAARAIAILPWRPDARLEMARVYRQWGDYRKEHREDPAEQFRRAVAMSRSILDRDRDAPYYMNLGLTYSLWADYQDQVGADSEDKRGPAIAAYTTALDHAAAFRSTDQQRDIWINLGISSFKRASLPRAKDPDGDFQRAIAALDKAKAIEPGHLLPHLYEGRIYERIAQRARARGLDPTRDLKRALGELRDGLAINPKLALLYNDVGAVYQDLASVAWDRGEDPEPALDQARTAFEQAIAAAPAQGFGYDNVGEVLIQRAAFQRARGEDPTDSATAAVTMVNQGIERIPNHSTFWADLGAAHAIVAAYELEHGRDPQRRLDEADAAIARSLGKNSGEAQAQLYLGETIGVRARWHARQGHGSAAEFEQAAAAFRKAIALAPENQDYPIMFGQFCRAWAQAQRDATGALAEGLGLAERVLARRPSWPDALVLRASLLLARALGAGDAAERRSHAAGAARDFTAALAGNHRLDKVWGQQASQAQQLAAP